MSPRVRFSPVAPQRAPLPPKGELETKVVMKAVAGARAALAELTQAGELQAPSLYSRELVELVFEQPCCRIGNVVDAGISKRQTASVYLKDLCDIGVLREVKAGREKLFIHPHLMKLLTAEEHTVPAYRVAHR